MTESERFGQRLGEAMKARDIASNAELARRVGTSKSRVGKWRDGSESPGYTHSIALARELQVTLDWLMLGTGEMDPATPSEAQTRLRLVRAVLDTPITPAADGDGREWVDALLQVYRRPDEEAPARRAGAGR